MKNKIVQISLLCLSLFIASCGGGGGGNDGGGTDNQVNTPDDPQNSNTWGNMVWDQGDWS
jgi:hypothetical protein